MGSVRWAFPCAAWRPCREEWLLAARLVQPEEKDRIGQFVFARDAKAALAGRLLIRKLVAEKLCIPWNEIHLQRTSKGKPFLANNVFSIYSSYNFNVSHQGDYAVLAAEPELQVGIDIMKTNLPGSSSIPNFFHIMKRQFTETEWGVIKSMGNEWMQLDMFHRHWALKESFLKAVGVGIGFNLQRIEFNVSPLQLEIGKVYKETKMLLDGDKEEEWMFEENTLVVLLPDSLQILMDEMRTDLPWISKDSCMGRHLSATKVPQAQRLPVGVLASALASGFQRIWS
ncbi:L-aminoadipate-semialdehyde dehydrogenase-phosphopantetheinyl transferase isoform X3 [Phalacrocorax carbo]|uniref:L-aminoadipate-semialdehyde dehydrogenase-phosphopantetheinyl transferase isoform X3 n=1 Tax=Phalacrocorax carbo TaxID=9209 RepID=UPI00311930E7